MAHRHTAALRLPPLTPRQAAVLRFIQTHIAENGWAPSLREISAHLGIRSTNGVHDHVKALENKGYIRTAGRQAARCIRVLVSAPALHVEPQQMSSGANVPPVPDGEGNP